MPEAIHVMRLVPDELLSNIKRGDCVLFLGADAPPARPEPAQALA